MASQITFREPCASWLGELRICGAAASPGPAREDWAQGVDERAVSSSSFLPLLGRVRALFCNAGLVLLELDPVSRGYAAWHSREVADMTAVEEACLAHCGFMAKRRCRVSRIDGARNGIEDDAPAASRSNTALVLRFQSRIDGLHYVIAVLLCRPGGRALAEDELALAQHAEELAQSVDSIKSAVRIDLSHAYGNPVAESAPWGTIALGATGRVCFMNARAHEIIERSAGLRVRKGRLEFARAAIARTFEGIVADLSGWRQEDEAEPDPPCHALSVPGGQGEPQLALRVAPCGSQGDRPGDAAMTVFTLDLLERARAEGPLLAAVFSLSRKEAQLAELLGSGCSLEDAARLMGISRNTARIHLSHIFAKTPARNQVELARMLTRMSLPPLPARQQQAAAELWQLGSDRRGRDSQPRSSEPPRGACRLRSHGSGQSVLAR